MNDSFTFNFVPQANAFLPGEMHDRRWLERRKHYFENPEEYKKHLKQESDEHWEQAKTGGVSKEMSVKEALRKKHAEEERKKAEEEEKRKAEEKRRRELGPNFPKVWDLSNKKEDPQKIFLRRSDDTLDWDVFKFKVYVNETDYFQTNFYEDLDNLKWRNTGNVKDIRKSKFDVNENFFNAIAAMYVLTWKSGFSLENITYNKNPKLVQSLCKFHLYFWFKRFQKQPDLLRRHLDPSDYKFLMSRLRLYHTWTEKHEQTHRIWGLQVKKLNERYGHGNWDNLRIVGRYGTGYSFRVINQTLPSTPERQFIRFIRPSSEGLNSLGQTLLMESIEAFVYSILGTQSDSRFSIVLLGGRSLQTQEIFHKLVGSSIVQTDNTILLNNFRTAVKGTNQILNLNLSPGLLIMPSELTILKDPIKGYNNTITTSTQKMRFGFSKNLNKVVKKASPLRLKGGTNPNRGPLLGAYGGGSENKSNNENYSLPIFFGTMILSLFVLEISFSSREGVRVKGHAKINN